jgi:hypothetical protein
VAAVKWAQAFILEISSNSPAIALLPLCDVPVVQQWLAIVDASLDATTLPGAQEAAASWSQGNDLQVQRSLPRLWLFMRHILSDAGMQRNQARCRASWQLFDRLVQVWSFIFMLLLLNTSGFVVCTWSMRLRLDVEDEYIAIPAI